MVFVSGVTMGDIPGTYNRTREKRDRYLRYFGVNLLIIVIGLLSILAFAWWKIIIIILLVPTFFGGYASGVFTRNIVVEYLADRGYEYEDADLWSMIIGIFGGIAGAVILAGLQVIFVILLASIGIIP